MGTRTQPRLSSQTMKWVGLVAAVWVQAISGNNYTFANYSAALKSLMGLTQLELNNLSVAKDVGKAFGLLAGLASDRLPTYVILLIGSLEGAVGYGAQWLVVNQTISPLPYWQMCIFMCMGGNSTTWMNTSVLVTCLRNFRRNRGPVSGILKGYVGLSTAIFTDICSALFADSPAYFLLMLTFVPGLVCVFAMFFMGEQATASSDLEEEDQESKYFLGVNTCAVVIACYLLIFDLTGTHSQAISRAFACGLVLLLASPLFVPIHAAYKERYCDGNRVDVEQALEPLLEEQGEGSGEERERVVKRPEIGEEHTIWEALRTVDFWVLFVSFLCGVGTGLAVMNNMAQIGLALGYVDVSIFVSLISIWGFFGRIASGTLSEFFIRKAATPRPMWNAVSQVLMTVGYIILALALPGSLYIGSVIVGLCYGVRLAVSVPTASELFGLKYYGLIYNILILNLPLGSFLFSGLLAGILYDTQATEGSDGSNTCVGAHCYRTVFIVTAFACLVGFGLDILLVFRTRRIYAKIYKMKMKKSKALIKN
ncbi:hypothetical protein AMTRI_Chr09g21470 [Amborella trichopoda]